MEQILYESDIVTLTFTKEEKLTLLTWKQSADSEEYREMFNTVIEFSKKNKINFMLSDMRNEGVVKPEDLQWLEVEVLNKAVEHGVLKIALVTEDTIFSNVYAETIKRKLKASLIEVSLFLDITSARSWLLSEN